MAPLSRFIFPAILATVFGIIAGNFVGFVFEVSVAFATCLLTAGSFAFMTSPLWRGW